MISTLRAISSSKAVLALGARAFGAALQFAANVSVGRLLGPAGSGVYFLFVSWTTVAGVIGSLGLPVLNLRRVAIGSSAEASPRDRAGAYALFGASLRIVLVTGLLLALLILTTVRLLAPLVELGAAARIFDHVAIGALPAALLLLAAEALKGVGRSTTAMTLQFATIPAGVLVALWIVPGASTSQAIVAHIGAMLAAAALCSLLVRRALRNASERGETSRPRVRPLAETARYLPLAIARVLYVQAPFLLLPFVATNDEIGLFGIAQRLVALSSLSLIALSSVYSARFARAFASGKLDTLRRTFSVSMAISAAIYTPFLLLFLGFGEPVMAIFGAEFVAGAPLLRLLAAGQLVNAGTGLATNLNFMIGEEIFETRLHGGMMVVFALLSLLAGLELRDRRLYNRQRCCRRNEKRRIVCARRTDDRLASVRPWKDRTLKSSLDFIVIGAQKSGTTSLHVYLGEHPSIHLPAEKEAPFFNLDDRLAKGWSWYLQSYFRGADPTLLWGKTSPQYLADPRVPERLHGTLPDAKLVAVLRDPLARAASHYTMTVKRGLEPRGFNDALRDALRPGALDEARSLPARIEHEPSCYLAWGEYGRLLEPYLQLFGRDALTVIYSDDLRNDPQRALDTVIAALGLEPGFTPDSLGQRFHVGGMRERIPGLERMVRENRLLRQAWRSLPERPRQRFSYWLKQRNTVPGGDPDRLALEPDVEREVRTLFREDLERLESLLGETTPWHDTLADAAPIGAER